jgi:two-component sensor histidine kinase
MTPPHPATDATATTSRLPRLLARAAWFSAAPWRGHVLAVALFGAALALRFSLDSALGNGFPFLTFFPAILLSAALGGRGAGALCSVLSVLAAWYWFVGPGASFALDFQGAVAVGFFALIAVVDVLIIDVMTRALTQLAAEQATSQALVAQRTTLFHELQHRVANNLMMVSSLLSTQQRQLRHNTEAVEALGAARRQFDLLSRIHRKLHDPTRADLPFADALQGLCGELLDATGAKQVRCQVTSAPVSFDMDRTITLSLLTLEVVTNAVKHAFAPGQPGLIDVALSEPARGEYLLTICDNGRGLPADFDPARSERLGMRIVQGFVSALRGTLAFVPAPQGTGTQVEVRFAAA